MTGALGTAPLGTVPFGGGGGTSSGVLGWGGSTTIIIEVDFSQAVDDLGSINAPFNLWDVAVWDDTTYEWQDSTTWTDITPWVLGVSTSARFSKEVQTYGTGSLQLALDNNDGRFSPLNTSSPYRIGDSTAIGMLRPIRVRAEYAGVAWPIFTGRIETWNDDYGDGYMSTVTVTATDAFAELGAFDSYEQSPQGAGETYRARIERILTAAGYDGDRSVDIGTNTFQATNLSSNVLTELKLVADSEGGAVWVGADGRFYADGQYALLEKERSNTVQAVFSDEDAADAIGYELASTAAAYDATKVVNIAAYARTGSTVQVQTSETSRALYGDRQASRTDLCCETDLQAEALAARDVALWQRPERRMESIRFSPLHQPTADQRPITWLALAQQRIQLRALVQVDRHPPGGYTISKLQYISGIRYQIGPSSWDVTLEFSSAEVMSGLIGSQWDGAVWDANGFAW